MDDDACGQQKRCLVVASSAATTRTIGGDAWNLATTLRKGKRVYTVTSQKEEEQSLHLSEKCERQLRSIFAKEEKNATTTTTEKKKTVLRVGVDGGGCAGFQYTFALVDEKDVDAANDRVFRGALYPEEVKVVCDEVSFAYLKGSTVDYSEEMIRSAFEVVKNPNAEQKCGCGVSFEAKF